jgi:cell wall assembly regulator SMI1
MAPDWVTLIRDGDVAGLRRWLDAGGRLSAKDQYNWSPLDHAVEKGRWEVVQLLLDRGGSVTEAFRFALERNRYQLAHRLLPLGVKAKLVQQALAQSSPQFWSDLELLRALLEAGADINHVDTLISNGNTPLHFAAAAGQIDAVKLLLAHGARPNAKNDKGQRPVDLASNKGHTEVASVLAAAKISHPTSIPPTKPAHAAKPLNLKGLKIRRSAQALTEGELAALEQKLGISLPDDYRAFLLRHNGGVPDPADFRFRLDDQESSERFIEGHVTWFYPVTAGQGRLAGECDLETVYSNFKGSALPRRMLPIASAEADPDGGMLCISVQGIDRGQIYYRPDVESSEDTVYRVADSFTAFLTTLGKLGHQQPDWVTAIQDGNLEGVSHWLDAGGRLTAQYRGQDTLRLAVADGNLEMVKLLLTRGASISEAYMHAKDKGQNVILH